MIEQMLEQLRKDASGIRPADLIEHKCDASFVAKFKDVVEAYRQNGFLRLHILYGSRIFDALEQLDIEPLTVSTYCQREFGNDIQATSIMLEVMAYVFRLDIGVFWAPGEVRRLCPELETDDDGLLVGPREKIAFEKDGVRYLTKYVVPYHQQINRYNLGLSGGFLDKLIRYRGRISPVYFGLRITDDMVVDASRYGMYFTKAFIRGPKGMSKDMLQNPRFPEDSAGTVTVHQRINYKSLESILYPLIKTEVMWSARDGIKTVQIEEVVSAENRCGINGDEVLNRYIHARWDSTKECFVHFDGAVRIYAKDNYQSRLDNDIKKSKQQALERLKLFRIDGEISLDEWSELTVCFFYLNELVLEYLGGAADE